MDILLPRLDIQIKQSLERAEMALARAKMAAALDTKTERYELEQRKISRARSLERHANLLADKALMELKAPADGIVYYGRCIDGKWGDMASMIGRLQPHNNVSSGTVVMTIIEPRPLYATGAVAEAKRPEVSAGQKVKVAPPLEGAARINGKVAKIDAVPAGGNRFNMEFELDQDAVPEWVVAGMNGKATVITYDKPDAITVPKAAAHADEEDEDKKYVWIVDPDDEEAKPERRNVTLGKASGNDVEIVKGLKSGEVVSLEDESGKAKEAGEKPAEE
jgi:multidrug efflux pump subunit AcrA (membrane-fusion protein)